jgi:hypothetical protein
MLTTQNTPHQPSSSPSELMSKRWRHVESRPPATKQTVLDRPLASIRLPKKRNTTAQSMFDIPAPQLNNRRSDRAEKRPKTDARRDPREASRKALHKRRKLEKKRRWKKPNYHLQQESSFLSSMSTLKSHRSPAAKTSEFGGPIMRPNLVQYMRVRLAERGGRPLSQPLSPLRKQDGNGPCQPAQL